MRRQLLNTLMLAFSPVCNYDFIYLREDEYFRRALKDSSIYIIAQRAELYFMNLTYSNLDEGQVLMEFEIHQRENPHVLKCATPVYQENLAEDISKDVSFHVNYTYPKPQIKEEQFPFNNVRECFLKYTDGTFITWISPENYIHNYLLGAFAAEIIGNIDEFIKYKVHYVGKATDQQIWKRLTGHSTLQEIISVEYPFHYGTLPTHEVAILFLKFVENKVAHTVSAGDPIDNDLIDLLLSKNGPSLKTIYSDFEKALIKAMQPSYNRQYYKNYPLSTDGLSKYKFNMYAYRICSDLLLTYADGELCCSSTGEDCDILFVRENRPLQIMKAEKKRNGHS